MNRAAVIAAALPLAFAATNCPDGAHVIVARGSLEPQGFGILENVKDRLLRNSAGADAAALVYPAGFNDYLDSETQGAKNMRKDIQDFADSCSQSPLVLMGYSQGAQVIGDALVGQGEGFEDMKDPIAQKYADQVACVIMMGDPSLNQTEKAFLAGNSTGESIFGRTNADDFAKLGLVDRIQSYCDEGDVYCASGDQLTVHLSYTFTYGRNASAFCVDKIKGWKPSTASGSTSGSNSTSGYATTTSSSSSSTAAASTGATGSGGSDGSAPATSTSGAPSATGASNMGAAAPGISLDLRACGLVVGAMLAGFWSLM